ncbi:MAG: YggT family protein [Holosporales bacterium]|jgi:YggT family protein|nr:YggT family protein [Holosporales bacterium]
MPLDIIVVPLFQIIDICIRMYKFLLFFYIIFHLLLSFNSLNRNSHIVCSIQSVLLHFVDPVLSPIRRIIPTFGIFDISPLILMLGLQFLLGVVDMTIAKYFR